MTAKQLIEILSAVPADTPVFVDGYEGGAEPPTAAVMTTFMDCSHERTVHNDWYYGRYEESEDGTVTAMYLKRR
jgi:hypothetical protein